MIRASLNTLAGSLVIAAAAVSVSYGQGRIEIDVHLNTENNTAVAAQSAVATRSITDSIDESGGAAYAGSVVVDLSVHDKRAVLINITRNNLAVGGTVAGSVVLTDAGLSPMESTVAPVSP